MKRARFLFKAFWFAAVLRGGIALAGVSVTDPRCEYLTDPLGIDTALPRFSWKLVDPAGMRGQKQTAWQIVVEADSGGGREPGTVLWDSGKVAAGESVNNVYAGKKLTSGQTCHWKVRVWDKNGKTSEWSTGARFSIGLLDPADWKGEWIGDKEADNSQHIWYRKTFSLERVPVLAFACLASIGYHELYVNGERIGTRVLSPEVTNLEKRAIYVTYDIAGALRQGNNVIAVWTGPGWARSTGSFGKKVWEQDSIFKCQVNLSNGARLHSDASWKCKISSSENLGLWKGGGEGEYGGELIDARRHIPDWNKPSFDDGNWSNATAYQKSLILSAAMQEPDRKVETLSPVSITETNGRYRIDMGRNFTGWFEIDLRNGRAGDVVKIMTANRAEETLEFKQESHYIFDAGGKGTFSHRFNYMAGRWVTVEGLSCKPEPKDIRGHIVTNDRKRIGSFECSNKLFNEIYETDLRTYIACTVNGVTMDCPHRERFGYGEVALACAWGCGMPNYESAPYYRKAARDWFDVQRDDGFVNTIAPQVYKGAGGTLWSSAPVTLSWEFYKAYGDKRQLEEAYPPMKRWVDFLNQSVSSNGVLTAYEKASRFLGDWATPHGSEYGNTPEAKLFNNCVYACCLDVLVQAAAILGRSEDVATYSARLANLRKSVHKHFFHEETKTYIDGRQLSMAFPLYTGITPEQEKQAVFANFVAEISRRKPFLDTGSSGLPILLKYIVEDAERADLLFPCLERTEYPGYGFFLKSGETTWPEYWKIVGEASRIHTCYTGISGYFMKAIGGIQPDPTAYGMQKFVIKPALVGDLSWVKCRHDSLYGRIVSNWRREGPKLTMDVTIPPNTTATVYVPASDEAGVTESGKPAAEAGGVAFLRLQDGRAVYRVGSGRYVFTSALPAVAVPGNLYPAEEQRRSSPGRTTYHIDPAGGDDARSGLAPKLAWRTFRRVNQLRLAPGDRVEIVAPGAFDQTLMLTGAGTAEAPVAVHFAPGRYDFRPDHAFRDTYQISNTNDDPDGRKAVGILLAGARHFRISGPGACLVYRGKMIEVCIERAEDITISGLEFDYHRPTVSEFKVAALGDGYVDLQIHKDSSYTIKDGTITWQGEGWSNTTGLAQELDLTTKEVWRRRDPLKGLALEEIKPFLVRARSRHDMKPQRVYQIRDTRRDCAGVFVQRSRNITWKDVKFRFLHGMGLVNQFSENLTFDAVTIAPDAASGRTTAAWADCLQISGCRGKVLVKNCVFSGAHDDAINIHGTYLRVVERLPGRQVKVRFMQRQTFGFLAFNPGDEVEFVHWDSLASYGSNRVKEARLLGPTELLLTLEKAVPDEFRDNDVLENVTWAPEVEIRACSVSHIPTRGFLISTRRPVLVEDNEFLVTHMSAILVAADAQGWYESGCARDMTIRRNRFIRCGEPVVHINPSTTVANHAFHRNIRIEDNQFVLRNAISVKAASTSGLRVTGNTIRAGQDSDDTRSVQTTDCTDVLIGNNSYLPLAKQAHKANPEEDRK